MGWPFAGWGLRFRTPRRQWRLRTAGKLEVVKSHGTNLGYLNSWRKMEDSLRICDLLDHEVPDAIACLVGALDWESQLGPFIGNERAAELIKESKTSKCRRLSRKPFARFYRFVAAATAEDVTVDYAEGFEGRGVLFISNHRDIVLDPSLINMALLSRGESTTQIGIGSNLLQTDWVENWFG